MSLKDHSQRIYDMAAVILSSLLLSSMAFYNGYPLVFNTDTAMYLEAASMHRVGIDRPVLYGLFMIVTSLGISLWFVVLAQSLIVSLTLFYYFKFFSPTENPSPNENMWRRIYFLGFVFLISFFMGGGFTTSWLMPDIFTPLSVMGMGLLIFIRNLQRKDRIIISVLTLLSVSMHNSHPYICYTVCLILLFASIFRVFKKAYKAADIRVSRILYIFLIIVTSQLFSSLINYSFGGGFKSSRGGVFFLMGSLVDMGVVKTYLNENCSSNNYFICHYKDSLPSNFLWDVKSPINLNGGWSGNEKEYSAIIKNILTTPKYLGLVVKGSAIASVKQFLSYGTGEAAKPWKRVNNSIADFYPQEYAEFDNSRQNNETLDFSVLNFAQTIIFSLSIFGYTLILLYNRSTARIRLFIFFIFLSILVNAWFCATFSGVFHRYQTRVTWLLPLPIFLYVMRTQLIKMKRTRMESQRSEIF